MQLKEIVKSLTEWAPPIYQESYDNSGWITGDPNWKVKNVLITLDVTPDVVQEAIDNQANLIIAHHPLIFQGIKQINYHHWVGKTLASAIKNDIAIYAIHTNLDNMLHGVNARFAKKIGLIKTQILQPKSHTLQKITVFVPNSDKAKVLDAMFAAGAGNIGNYYQCSFQLIGQGTFRPNEDANPTIGKNGNLEQVDEVRIEVLVSQDKINNVISAMKTAHPYEEVAYYQHELINTNQGIGSGMIGYLEKPMLVADFFHHITQALKLEVIKHTRPAKEKIQKIALCGGSGFFLLADAKRSNADIFITSDIKYHEFFEANDQLILADIGHFESEIATKELIFDYLTEKYANIAVILSKLNTNPVQYFK